MRQISRAEGKSGQIRARRPGDRLGRARKARRGNRDGERGYLTLGKIRKATGSGETGEG